MMKVPENFHREVKDAAKSIGMEVPVFLERVQIIRTESDGTPGVIVNVV
jgi:hypothetical protein